MWMTMMSPKLKDRLERFAELIEGVDNPVLRVEILKTVIDLIQACAEEYTQGNPEVAN